MKAIKLMPIFLASMFSVSVLAGTGIKVASADAESYYVDFFNNYKREEFSLSSGFIGKGNNLIYETRKVTKDSLVTKPDDPSRKNYDFKGWFKEANCENEWNFSTDVVSKHTRLFAKWTLAEGSEIVEPTYTPPSTVLPDTAATDYELDSIMYSKVEENNVNLTTAAINKLKAHKDNILPYIEYRVKNNKSLTATCDDDTTQITLTCEADVRHIAVTNVTAALKVPENYEYKAVNYEKLGVDEENYHVMLAGSSSIEFWETSKEDLDPIVSYNHGIGGTTIEQWDTCLNQRLVYPAKPKMVVYYVGINNVINSKESSEVIIERLYKFFNHTHAALPNTQVQYILMNLLPGFMGYANTINAVNQAAREYQNSNPWLTLIDAGKVLLKENGIPSAAYFRTDGLHLSYYGYVLWGGVVKESILEGLENM